MWCTLDPVKPRRRMVTVKMAIRELGVKRSTVYQWIADSTESEVHRENIRLPDARGRMRLTLAVDVEALLRRRDGLPYTD